MGKIVCIKKLSIFEELSPEELENVAQFSRKKTFKAGEFLFRENEPVKGIYIVIDGRIQMSKLSFDGKELILGFATNDAVFGEEALFSDENYSFDARALEESCVTICSKKNIEELFLKKPEIAVKVIKSLSLKLSQSTKQISDLAFRSVRERLINNLYRLAKKYGHQTEEGWQINFKLTHSDLASIINASRVTVTQTLSNLREEGLITSNDKGIILKDMNVLEQKSIS